MRIASREVNEWIDGFLFVANKPILDLLNTKPVLENGPTELLPDVRALERWLIASGMVASRKAKATVRGWRQAPEAATFLDQLIAFRERLREAVVRMENGSSPTDAFLAEVNSLLLQYPCRTSLHKRDGKVIQETLFRAASARRPLGADHRCHGRSSRGTRVGAHSQMRIMCPSFLRHEQERLT